MGIPSHIDSDLIVKDGVMEIDRERAKIFDREAERYDRCRPSYPDELIDEVLGRSPQGLSVLDVATGTGIAARLMALRGARVEGVELNEHMAEISRRHAIPTEVAPFETWNPAERIFDVVTCAQAWHWLEPCASTAKVASVLRPGGRLCLFWNIGHHPDDIADALQVAYQRIFPRRIPRLVIGYAASRAGDPTVDLKMVAESLSGSDKFINSTTKSFAWSRTYSRDQWLAQLRSHSDHAALPSDQRRSLFGEISGTLDGFGGTFRMTYVSVLIATTRT